MNEIIKRVSWLIARDDDLCGMWQEREVPCDLYPECGCAVKAREIIAAMRKPTEAMLHRGHRESLKDGAHDCEVPMGDVWRAMIDEALKD